MFQPDEEDFGSMTLTIDKPKKVSDRQKPSLLSGSIAFPVAEGEFTGLKPMKDSKGSIIPNRWGFRGLQWRKYDGKKSYDFEDTVNWIRPTEEVDDNGNRFLYFHLDGAGEEDGDMLAKKKKKNRTVQLTEGEKERLGLDVEEEDIEARHLGPDDQAESNSDEANTGPGADAKEGTSRVDTQQKSEPKKDDAELKGLLKRKVEDGGDSGSESAGPSQDLDKEPVRKVPKTKE